MRRWGCILGMLLAPWGFVTANLCYALAISDGGSDNTGADALLLFGDHPLLVRVGLTAGMVGCILLIPAVSGLFRLAPGSRAVLIGGSLMTAGYVCYFGVLHADFRTLAMAEHGGDPALFASVIDAGQADPTAAWVFLLFVLGNLVGTTIVGVGLLSSRRVPRLAAIGLLCWPPLHVIGLIFFGNEIPQVLGAVLQALGFAGCALTLAHRTASERLASAGR